MRKSLKAKIAALMDGLPETSDKPIPYLGSLYMNKAAKRMMALAFDHIGEPMETEPTPVAVALDVLIAQCAERGDILQRGHDDEVVHYEAGYNFLEVWWPQHGTGLVEWLDSIHERIDNAPIVDPAEVLREMVADRPCFPSPLAPVSLGYLWIGSDSASVQHGTHYSVEVSPDAARYMVRAGLVDRGQWGNTGCYSEITAKGRERLESER